MTIRTLVVDDEALAREGLKIKLAQYDDFEVVAECANGSDAIKTLLNKQVDVVFLDIRMPKLTGFDVINAVGVDQMPLTVFLTAYDEYALEAFDVNAIDYLMKPIVSERFAETISKIRNNIGKQRISSKVSQLSNLLNDLAPPSTSPAAQTNKFVVRSHGHVHFVAVDDIVWVEAEGDYVNLHTRKRSFLLRETMKNMESKLHPNGFTRVHRSAIIRWSLIEELRLNERGDYEAVLADQSPIKVGRAYKESLLKLLNIEM